MFGVLAPSCVEYMILVVCFQGSLGVMVNQCVEKQKCLSDSMNRAKNVKHLRAQTFLLPRKKNKKQNKG